MTNEIIYPKEEIKTIQEKQEFTVKKLKKVLSYTFKDFETVIKLIKNGK